MESSRLKNIIILILVLLNLSLLLSLGGRQTSARSARRQSTEQLVELFAANEVTLDPNLIPRPALHSFRLRLRHPVTGELLDLTAPLPEDMARLLEG